MPWARVNDVERVLLLLLITACSRLVMYFWLTKFASYADLAISPPSPLCRWDCEWYLQIAETGYSAAPNAKGQAAWAFFPAYPLTVGLISQVTHLPTQTAGILVSFIALFVGLLHLQRFCSRRMSSGASWFATALLAFSPFSIYFSSVFSEALFLAVIMLALTAMDDERWWRGALWTGVATATRPTGVLLLPVLLVLMHRRGALKMPWHRLTALLLLSCSGLLSFMGFLALKLGDPLAFIHIQAAWFRRPDALLIGLSRLVYEQDVHAAFGFAVLMLAMLFVLLLWSKRDYAMAWLLLGVTAIPAVTGFAAIQRFAFACAPVYVALARISEGRRMLRFALLVATVPATAVYAFSWIQMSDFTM